MPRLLGAYTAAPVFRPIRFASVLMLLLAASACSVDIPIPGFTSQDTTASIDTDAARLSPAMSAEDWTLARAALKKALEAPSASGEPGVSAAWGNPNSGLHGTFARDPDPKAQWLAQGGPKDGAACQYFVASVDGAPAPAEREGLACRDKSGLWSVKEARERALKS